MKRYLALGVAFAALFYCLPVEAQNSGSVPQYAVPIGQGAGHSGFDSAAPGTAGWALVSNGSGSKPTFQSVAGAAFGAQNANKAFAGPSTGADAVPTFRALVGADLPLPGAASLGGVKSLTASTNNFLTGLGTDGAFTRAQPAFSSLSGSWSCAQAPALTGNVTTSAGSCTTTIAALAVTNGMLAGSIAASKLVGTDIATLGTITSGTWNGTKIALAYGGTNADLSATGGTSQFLKQNTAGGAIVPTRPACADLSNASASCSTDATNAANISSGTLPAARLPSPGASTLGAVNSKDCTSGGQFLQKINTDGTSTCATPSGGGNVSNSGTPTSGQFAVWSSSTVVQGVSPATQSDQQTGTSTTAAVTPAHQQDHDSANKVVAYVTQSSGTYSLSYGYNVASISKTATGTVTVNFTTPFSSTNFACTYGLNQNAGPTNMRSLNENKGSRTASAISVGIATGGTTGAAVDSDFSVICAGRQ